MVIAQIDDHALPLGQGVDGLAQGDLLQQLLLQLAAGEQLLERRAVVPGAALDGVRRPGGRLGRGDLLGLQARLGAKLADRRLAVKRREPLPRALMKAARSLRLRLTFTVPSSRRK